MQIPRIIVAGSHSGVGKTTVALGLMGALRARHFIVQGFKVGPDYIDGTYHTAVTGRPSRNLDSWMAGPQGVQEVLRRGGPGADISVIEGVMGYYDGKDSKSIAGSTAALADLTRTPVILVIDVAGTSRSAAAIVKGFQSLDTTRRIRGVIVNRVGSPRHYEMVRDAIEEVTGIPVLGYLSAHAMLNMPERHLGLIPAIERGEHRTLLDGIIASVRDTINLTRVIDIAREAPPISDLNATDNSKRYAHPKVAIAVAKDSAFNFYYQENLELLIEAGAEIQAFSPLAGDRIPKDADALYMGGGFPEEFLRELSNPTLLQDFRHRIVAGLPTVAECGGFMFLGRSVADTQGHVYPMVGAVPVTTAMQPRLAALGYREIESQSSNPLLESGEHARGHEFHYSRASYDFDQNRAYRLSHHGNLTLDGFATRSLVAGYVHHYFLSNPLMAQRFVASALAYQTRKSRV